MTTVYAAAAFDKHGTATLAEDNADDGYGQIDLHRREVLNADRSIKRVEFDIVTYWSRHERGTGDDLSFNGLSATQLKVLGEALARLAEAG